MRLFLLSLGMFLALTIPTTPPLSAQTQAPSQTATTQPTKSPSLTPRQQSHWNTFDKRWRTVRGRLHQSVIRLSDAFDEAPFDTLNARLDETGLAASIEDLNDEIIAYQGRSLTDMQALIRKADKSLFNTGVLLRDASKGWTSRERARAQQIRNDLISTRAALTSALQAFTTFRKATPLK